MKKDTGGRATSGCVKRNITNNSDFWLSKGFCCKFHETTIHGIKSHFLTANHVNSDEVCTRNNSLCVSWCFICFVTLNAIRRPDSINNPEMHWKFFKHLNCYYVYFAIFMIFKEFVLLRCGAKNIFYS